MLLVPSRVGAILNVNPSSNLKGCKFIGVKVSHQKLKSFQGLISWKLDSILFLILMGLLVGFGVPIFKCDIEFSVTFLSKFLVNRVFVISCFNYIIRHIIVYDDI
jgi:hypothetical protein